MAEHSDLRSDAKRAASVKFEESEEPAQAEEAPLLAEEAPAPQKAKKKTLRKTDGQGPGGPVLVRKRKPPSASERPSFPAAPKLLVKLADRKALNIDQLGCVFVEIVLWASCWGIVDMTVNMTQFSITSDPILGSMLCMILYGFVTLGGVVIALFVLDDVRGSPQDVPLVPPKVVEFVSLVMLLAGSWGVVDSLASLLARGNTLLVLFWYLFFTLVASLVLTWHHLQNPNELLDRLVLT